MGLASPLWTLDCVLDPSGPWIKKAQQPGGWISQLPNRNLKPALLSLLFSLVPVLPVVAKKCARGSRQNGSLGTIYLRTPSGGGIFLSSCWGVWHYDVVLLVPLQD